METSENIKSYYQDYISIYKDETDRLKQFKTFIDKTESDQLFDRKNFVGHITGSAIIFDYKNSKVLLIKHIILQRWLQPGGHIEKTDASILDGIDFENITMETIQTVLADLDGETMQKLMEAVMGSGRMEMPDMGGGGFGGMGSSGTKLQYVDDDPASYSTIFESAKTNV
ncbi:MAG: hypothetical protein IJ340_14105, partial [Odoribacter sp.]|nr:hypothetical protein [Odoribacter sp.]